MHPTKTERINGWLKAARDYGQYAVLAGTALTLVYALYAAIRTNEFRRLFGVGVGVVLALTVGQFVAGRFLGGATGGDVNSAGNLSLSSFLFLFRQERVGRKRKEKEKEERERFRR